MTGFVMPAQAETNATGATGMVATQPDYMLSASQYIAGLPATADPIENEARDFFVFLGEEKPEFVATFIKVYGGALNHKFDDKTTAKRYVVLGAQDYIVDEKQYFSASLLTSDQLNELDEKLRLGLYQDKSEIYGRFIDKNTDS